MNQIESLSGKAMENISYTTTIHNNYTILLTWGETHISETENDKCTSHVQQVYNTPLTWVGSHSV
jgi:hypothetical protein